jgi:hypothetical protein
MNDVTNSVASFQRNIKIPPSTKEKSRGGESEGGEGEAIMLGLDVR